MKTVQHKFVELIPDQLEDNTVYICLPYCTVVHKCACGCGAEVVTPLSPTDWKLIFDGETISLSPSIGNWSFPCRSHYWIINSKIRYSRSWSLWEVERGRKKDAKKKKQYFNGNARGRGFRKKR
jgi:hypothetical protein